jgi:CubicO group peptidase (beta-lactamase class C family)
MAFGLKPDYNNVYYSTARSMARYGLLLLNKGVWNGNPVLNDSVYFKNMTNSSQNINQSYGYLTWLNGKDSYMLPQSQIVFGGSTIKDAPDDLFAALGKNGPDNQCSPFKKSDCYPDGKPTKSKWIICAKCFQ